MNEFIFRFRALLSAAGSAIVMLSLLLFHFGAPAIRHSETNSTPIELILDSPETEQQVAPQLVASPEIQQNTTHALARPEKPVEPAVAEPADPAAPVRAVPVVPELVLPPVQASPAPSGLAIPPVAPSAISADSVRNAEAIYIGKVRAYLQTIKRYPTGREASLQRPSGIVVVWFMVRRNGEILDAGIETSSGSMLLDNAALATVRRGVYPVFPFETWPGKAQQHFTVALDFIPAQ
ncbi:MAG: TonB family protein [Gallionella sp.]|nr:TonB family protein [Gallionella sp.]